MTDLQNLQWDAYQTVAYKIISQSLLDLKNTRSRSASVFFDSEWFRFLCRVINTDPIAVRSIATRLPGYIDKERLIQPVHKKRSMRVISPTGKKFVVRTSDEAAALIGCSRQAVSLAMKDRRKCMGWSLVQPREAK
jgi:hypothetical protein